MTNINNFVNELRTQIVFNADTAQAVSEIDKMQKKFQQVEEQTEKLEQRFNDLGDVSARVAAVGAVIFAPAILSSQKYIQAMGRSEEISRRFIKAQERTSQAQLELGRKATASLLPYQEALARIIERVNDLPQGVFDAGLAAGGGLVLLGAVGVLGQQIGLFVAQSTRLIAAINTGTASAGLRYGAYAGVGVGAVAAGSFLGVGATRLLGAATGDERLQNYGLDEAGETLKQALFILADQLIQGVQRVAEGWVIVGAEFEKFKLAVKDKFADLVETLQKMIWSIENVLLDTELLGVNLGEELGIERKTAKLKSRTSSGEVTTVVDPVAEIEQERDRKLQAISDAFRDFRVEFATSVNGGSAAPSTGGYTNETLAAFGQYRDDIAAMEAEFFQERVDRQAAYQEESITAQQAYDDQLAQLLKTYNSAREQAEKQYQQKVSDLRNQAQVAALESELQYREDRAGLEDDYREAETQAMEEYNRNRIKAERDYRDQLANAAAKLDAISVLDILRQRNNQFSDEDSDFAREKRQRKEELQDRLSDLDKTYQKEKAQRNRQLSEQLAAADRAYSEQQRQLKDNYQQQREQATEQYKKLQQQREQAYNRELRDLERQHVREMELREKHFRDQVDQMNGWNRYSAEMQQQYLQQLQQMFGQFMGMVASGDSTLQTTTNSSGIVTIGGSGNGSGNTFRRSIPQYADGGYTEGGLAFLHAGEYVMTAAAARAAERGLGPLTQQKIMNMATNTNSPTINNTFNISGAGNPAATAREVKRIMLQTLTMLGQSKP
jgi:hypothetical protein